MFASQLSCSGEDEPLILFRIVVVENKDSAGGLRCCAVGSTYNRSYNTKPRDELIPLGRVLTSDILSQYDV